MVNINYYNYDTVNRNEAIELLNSEGWTKADVKRAFEALDFGANPDIDELTIRRAASQFAGVTLLERQRLQAAQRGLVTRRNREIQEYIAQIDELVANGGGQNREQIAELNNKISVLIADNSELNVNNEELRQANNILQEDNNAMRNIVDRIRFLLTVEIKKILSLRDVRQIQTKLVQLINNISG